MIKSVLEAQGFEGPFLGWCGGIQILRDFMENYRNLSCQTWMLSNLDIASSLFCTLVNDEPDHKVYVQILVHSSPWLGTEEDFSAQAPTQPDPASPKAALAPRGAKGIWEEMVTG